MCPYGVNCYDSYRRFVQRAGGVEENLCPKTWCEKDKERRGEELIPPKSWSTGITPAFPVHVVPHCHPNVHMKCLLSLHHSNYGPIKNMMASYLHPFPLTKQSKPSQGSYIHLGLIWLPLRMLWSSSHSSLTLNLSSLCHFTNLNHSLILLYAKRL